MFANLNTSRFILCTLILTIFTFIYQWFVHGNLLANEYSAIADLWRNPEEVDAMFGAAVFFNVALSAVLTLLYSKNHEGLGVDEGVRFGVCVGLLVGILSAMAYMWLPITTTLSTLWFVDGLVFSLLAGIILSLTYANNVGRPKKK